VSISGRPRYGWIFRGVPLQKHQLFHIAVTFHIWRPLSLFTTCERACTLVTTDSLTETHYCNCPLSFEWYNFVIFTYLVMSLNTSACKVNGRELGDQGSLCHRSRDILFSFPPRVALGSTQPLSQWVLGRFSGDQSCRVLNRIIHILVPRCMRGTCPPCRLYTSIVWRYTQLFVSEAPFMYMTLVILCM
jgi:hypothetical protein